MTRTRLRLIGVAALAGSAWFASPAFAKARSEPVQGRWGGAVPCVPTAVDPATNHTTCVGSTTWTGDLTGQTHYTFDGTVDLVTGAGQGVIDETFVGRDGRGRVGTLRFSETIVSRPTGLPSTGSVRIVARVVDGAGDFARMSGQLTFVGLVNVAAGDLGTYSGRLIAPER